MLLRHGFGLVFWFWRALVEETLLGGARNGQDMGGTIKEKRGNEVEGGGGEEGGEERLLFWLGQGSREERLLFWLRASSREERQPVRFGASAGAVQIGARGRAD